MGLKKVISFIIQHPISGKSKIKSLFRFFWWQIRGLVTTKNYIHQFTPNSKLILTKGMTGATGNLYCGLHEYKEMLFVLHFLRPEDFFIDIGANIGSFTILASAEVGSKTYSFEPLPITFKQLKDNVILNNINSKVTLFNMGLASQKGELYFSDEKDSSMNHVETVNINNAIAVHVDTLNNLLSDLAPILIKIDVEGFELDVLRGSFNILNSLDLKAIIIELNGSGANYGFSDEQIDELLKSFRFEAYNYDPFTRSLFPAQLNAFDNLIYIRDLDFVNHRLSTAKKFKILDLEI